MIDLTGYHVLVTGGSRGIGAAAARLFARCGATVMIHYREREDEAKAVLDELHAIASREHLRFPCDFTEAADAGAAAADAGAAAAATTETTPPSQ